MRKRLTGSRLAMPVALCLLVCLWAPVSGDPQATQQGQASEEKGKNLEREEKSQELGLDSMLKKIHWLGHASFRIEGERIVYFDPFRLKKGAAAADVIFVSHSHSDHCSPEDIKLIQKKETVLVTTSDCVKKLSGEVVTVKPGDTLTVKGLKIQVVPAYNTNKKFHPRDKGWAGFVVTVEGQRVYHAGDTDFIPEMKKLDVDVALLPVSGTYVMTAEEAAQAAKAIGPRLAIPMHYGTIVGDEKDALTFKEKSGVRVEILKRETR